MILCLSVLSRRNEGYSKRGWMFPSWYCIRVYGSCSPTSQPALKNSPWPTQQTAMILAPFAVLVSMTAIHKLHATDASRHIKSHLSFFFFDGWQHLLLGGFAKRTAEERISHRRAHQLLTRRKTHQYLFLIVRGRYAYMCFQTKNAQKQPLGTKN
jgi:hypothetical protein